ncbi:hypothetical protein Dimus_023260 [Dionaea muscipula]
MKIEPNQIKFGSVRFLNRIIRRDSVRFSQNRTYTRVPELKATNKSLNHGPSASNQVASKISNYNNCFVTNKQNKQRRQLNLKFSTISKSASKQINKQQAGAAKQGQGQQLNDQQISN